VKSTEGILKRRERERGSKEPPLIIDRKKANKYT
jgi:hypothetical protein